MKEKTPDTKVLSQNITKLWCQRKRGEGERKRGLLRILLCLREISATVNLADLGKLWDAQNSGASSFMVNDISFTALLWATSDYEWGWNTQKHCRETHSDFSESTHPHG